MILNVVIDDQVYEFKVPDSLLSQADDFFDRLDRDMDAGWQMSRDWVAHPDALQRCQIVADKLLTALESENQRLGLLLAGYILKRLPGVEAVELDIQGEMTNHQFRGGRAAAGAPVSVSGVSKPQAMEQAGKDVTDVFKVGRGYRFSVFDHATETWQDSPQCGSEQQAARLRQLVLKERYESLLAGPKGADG
jgi:hypothetical protein